MYGKSDWRLHGRQVGVEQATSEGKRAANIERVHAKVCMAMRPLRRSNLPFAWCLAVIRPASDMYALRRVCACIVP